MGFFKKTEEEKSKIAAIKQEKHNEKLRKMKESRRKLKEKVDSIEQKQIKHKVTNQKTLGVKLEHLGGCPKINSGKDIRVTRGNRPKEIKLGTHAVTVKSIDWDEDGKRSVGKAAVGAIVGGVLGPAGMIAGAAVGGRRKDNSVLIMTVEDNGIEYTVYLRANQKEFQEISSFLY